MLITRLYYRGAASCLLVHEVASQRSLENIKMWPGDVWEHTHKAGSWGIRGISRQEEDLLFVEVNTKSRDGVQDVFVRAAFDKVRKGGFYDGSPGVKLSTPGAVQAKKSGITPPHIPPRIFSIHFLDITWTSPTHALVARLPKTHQHHHHRHHQRLLTPCTRLNSAPDRAVDQALSSSSLGGSTVDLILPISARFR
ncbi:hypothetical protein C8J57DRAFT_1714186 [Mycena rebaudengoi]|nr:hypothetical protein C8J57DRAFT_1714186 [Mycena rebaudengoi]